MRNQRIDVSDQMRLATEALARGITPVVRARAPQRESWTFGSLCALVVIVSLVAAAFGTRALQHHGSPGGASVSDASRMVRTGNATSRTNSGRLLLTFVRTSKSKPGVAAAREAMDAAKQNAISAALNCVDRSKRRDVSIDVGALAGGSAGLMLALSIVDALEPLDIAGEIAGTGTITRDGIVGPIAEIAAKARAARHAGAAMFLVPKAQAAEAERSARGLRVVGVDTLDEAVRSLGRTHGCSQVKGEK